MASITQLQGRRPARARSSAPSLPWGAIVGIAFPEGIQRHPRLLDVVESEMDRVCAIDVDSAGIRLAFGLRGGSEVEATQDVEVMTARLLGRLGLGPDAIVERQVVERTETYLDGCQASALDAPDLHRYPPNH
jgi:hypothetical protein